jgi:hypothetical protein
MTAGAPTTCYKSLLKGTETMTADTPEWIEEAKRAVDEAICRERCAQVGDAPCGRITGDWTGCDECQGIRMAALHAFMERVPLSTWPLQNATTLQHLKSAFTEPDHEK